MYTFRSVFFRIKNDELGHGHRQNYLQRSTLERIQFKFERQLIQVDLHILPSCSCDNQDWLTQRWHVTLNAHLVH